MSTAFPLVLATGNAGKLREYAQLLESLPLSLSGARDFPGAPEVAEDADIYVENARLKAIAMMRHAGLPALADDSGLEVDALGGAPGVRSARFAGTPSSDARNLALLLERMRAIPEGGRTARFRCVIAVVRPDGAELVAEGACEGSIAFQPRGSGGFGYDPVFLHPPFGAHTFAEIPAADKNRISHRAVACAELRLRLVDFLSC